MSKIGDAIERIAELEAELADPLVSVEVQCGSIPIDWREIGGVRIGLDVAGNAVEIQFPDNLANTYGWVGNR